MMSEDLRSPLPVENRARVGDARELTEVADGSAGGVITSPPYLSRHNYAAIARPYEDVLSFWEGRLPRSVAIASQVRASPACALREAASRAEVGGRVHAAAAESAENLRRIGESSLASRVAAYFADMFDILGELHRALRPGSPCWMVVGGARLKDVYIPSDLILAEVAGAAGFRVESVRIAREVTATRRKFASVGHVAPRESILVLRRAGAA